MTLVTLTPKRFVFQLPRALGRSEATQKSVEACLGAVYGALVEALEREPLAEDEPTSRSDLERLRGEYGALVWDDKLDGATQTIPLAWLHREHLWGQPQDTEDNQGSEAAGLVLLQLLDFLISSVRVHETVTVRKVVR